MMRFGLESTTVEETLHINWITDEGLQTHTPMSIAALLTVNQKVHDPGVLLVDDNIPSV